MMHALIFLGRFVFQECLLFISVFLLLAPAYLMNHIFESLLPL
jgi:hypothetical protein